MNRPSCSSYAVLEGEDLLFDLDGLDLAFHVAGGGQAGRRHDHEGQRRCHDHSFHGS